MKCPECVKAGLKSTVSDPDGGFSTCMGDHRYYDEDGNYHHHDPNYTSRIYRCSNGHEWDDAQPNRCPSCDWTGGGSYSALQQRWRGAAGQEKASLLPVETEE